MKNYMISLEISLELEVLLFLLGSFLAYLYTYVFNKGRDTKTTMRAVNQWTFTEKIDSYIATAIYKMVVHTILLGNTSTIIRDRTDIMGTSSSCYLVEENFLGWVLFKERRLYCRIIDTLVFNRIVKSRWLQSNIYWMDSV